MVQTCTVPDMLALIFLLIIFQTQLNFQGSVTVNKMKVLIYIHIPSFSPLGGCVLQYISAMSQILTYCYELDLID